MTNFAILWAAVAMQSPAAASTPPPADAIAYFTGSWRCDGHFTPSMRPLSSTLEFVVDPATGAYLKAHRDVAPATYAANEVWAASRGGGYRMVIADSYSGLRWYTSEGWVEGRWTWERRREENEPAERFIYIRQGDDQMTLEWWTARQEGLAMGDTLDCVRQA